MDASMDEKTGSRQSDPRVGFLYKTMLERDPKKRRVKPVSNSRIQVDFAGLEDSEEDSDFDISKHSQGFDGSPNEGSGELRDEDEDDAESDEDDDDEDEDDDDEDDDDESDEEDMEDEDVSMNMTANNSKSQGADEDVDDNDFDEDDDVEDDEIDSDDEAEDDDSDDEHDAEEEEETDDEEEGEDVGSENDDDAGNNEETKSPEIKALGQMWSMIDSDEDDEDYVPRKKKKKKADKGGGKSQPVKKPKAKSQKPKGVKKSSQDGQEDVDSLQDSAPPQGRIKVIVCCVCLSDRSADDDEIVECDNCGISVHEGCYGISESHSTASTESSASTEPWFCDACKANAKPVCELCPNTGGIFKETDNGKWVHIVCALYTPGVAFGDVDKLSLVTLFEMPYSKWGARECSLCEDSRFSQTGVCINCDAGMCKAYFHVTCAQREGLLAEAAPEEVMDIADPFFAYCKLHADKLTSKIKRRNWLAIQSHVKTHTLNLIEDEKERLRFQRKLSRHRDMYSVAKLKRPPSWVPTQKMVRHLHTSPSAVRGFLRKAELMGVITQAQTIPLEKQEVRKKAQGQPAFTSEFINYFMDRNIKVDNLKITQLDLNTQNNKLQAQEKVVRKQYDKLHAEVNDLKQTGSSVRREAESLWGMLQDIHGKPVPHMPELFRNRKRTRSPSKKDAPTSPTALINQCGVCHNTTEQHLLAKCDSCKKHYHLGCLDPPLTRMPKKTKLFGWQCSYCVSSSSDDSMAPVPIVDGPRKLRETIKEPDKFFHLSHIQDSLKSQQKKSLMNKKNKQRREAARAKRVNASLRHSAKSAGQSPPHDTKPKSASKNISKFSEKINFSGKKSSDTSAAASTSATKSASSQEDAIKVLDIMCVVCNKDGLPTDTVRCDECMLSYHLSCLDPPMKKSPKVRGYAWHCEACDMLDSTDDDDREPRGRKDPGQHATHRPTAREASNSILFDIDVSSDDSSC